MAAMIDPVFYIWQLRNAIFNIANNNIAEWVLVAIGISAVSFSLHDVLKDKTVLPFVVTLSGFFCVIPEVFVDDMWGNYDRPESIVQGIFRIVGRDISWFSVAIWFAFGTAVSIICYTLIFRDVQTKWLWIGFAIAGVLDLVFEETMFISHGLYVFYEPQPFVILTKFPWWRMTTSTTGLFLSAALAYRYREHLKGWLVLLMFMVTPLSYFAVQGCVRISAYIVDKENYSWSAGILICMLCITIVALTMQLILKRNPFDMRGKNAS